MFLTTSSSLLSSSSIITSSPSLFVTLEKATYNCPCVKTCLGRYSPTLFRDCPWLLLIVIAKQTNIWYFLLFRTNGNVDLVGEMTTLAIYDFLPHVFQLLSVCFDESSAKLTIVILVPLHNPALWLIYNAYVPLCGGCCTELLFARGR